MSASTSKRKTYIHDQLDVDKRLKHVSDLSAIHGMRKVALAKTLHALNAKGLLTDALVATPSEREYHRQVHNGFNQAAMHTSTPYGVMLRVFELPVCRPEKEQAGARKDT